MLKALFPKKPTPHELEIIRLQKKIAQLEDENHELQMKLKVKRVIDAPTPVNGLIMTSNTYEVFSRHEKMTLSEGAIRWRGLEIVKTNSLAFTDGLLYYLSEYEEYMKEKGVKG